VQHKTIRFIPEKTPTLPCPLFDSPFPAACCLTWSSLSWTKPLILESRRFCLPWNVQIAAYLWNFESWESTFAPAHRHFHHLRLHPLFQKTVRESIVAMRHQLIFFNLLIIHNNYRSRGWQSRWAQIATAVSLWERTKRISNLNYFFKKLYYCRYPALHNRKA
jgi:hypothetical protein